MAVIRPFKAVRPAKGMEEKIAALPYDVYSRAEAKVVVEDVEGNPGYYNAKFYLRPHYQLEGLTTSLRLTTKIPSAGK